MGGVLIRRPFDPFGRMWGLDERPVTKHEALLHAYLQQFLEVYDASLYRSPEPSAALKALSRKYGGGTK